MCENEARREVAAKSKQQPGENFPRRFETFSQSRRHETELVAVRKQRHGYESAAAGENSVTDSHAIYLLINYFVFFFIILSPKKTKPFFLYIVPTKKPSLQ